MGTTLILEVIKVIAKDAPTIAKLLQFPPKNEIISIILNELGKIFALNNPNENLASMIENDPDSSTKLAEFQHSFILKLFEPLSLNLDINLSADNKTT